MRFSVIDFPEKIITGCILLTNYCLPLVAFMCITYCPLLQYNYYFLPCCYTFTHIAFLLLLHLRHAYSLLAVVTFVYISLHVYCSLVAVTYMYIACLLYVVCYIMYIMLIYHLNFAYMLLPLICT